MHKLVLTFLFLITSMIATSEESESVSMLKVIANPESLIGKTIMVKGYLRYEREANILFYDKETYENWRTKEGVWLSFDSLEKKTIDLMSLDGKAVTVYGKVNPKHNGHKGCCSGSILVIHIENSIAGI